ncbi:MAG: hypothetical protein AB7E05_10010 [Sphingobium sp.]
MTSDLAHLEDIGTGLAGCFDQESRTQRLTCGLCPGLHNQCNPLVTHYGRLDAVVALPDGIATYQGGLLDSLKKAFAEQTLNTEIDHHPDQEKQGNNSRNGYGWRISF